MFYRPAEGHGLPHSPFYALVTPRPIGWISTRASSGDNLAPYSFFNAVAAAPPQVVFGSNGLKDTLNAVRETGVFAVNIVSEALLQVMNATSARFPRGTDEFLQAGIEKAECISIPCPRVARAPATLECRVVSELVARGQDNVVVLGEVTGIHIADEFLVDGRFDVTLFHPAARMGYQDYTIVRDVFSLQRP
jgi:flavin reductase (DIM6/NTAB) family NADH-FMN oxidoreductase RutF